MMVFHWTLGDSKCPEVSMTLLSILAVLNNAIVWMVSTRPPTSKSSSPFNNRLFTVPVPIPWDFYTSALTDGLSLKFKWQQISSSHRDSSEYSGWSH